MTKKSDIINNIMFDKIRDEIWEKQIGNREFGTDFAGREIHYNEFENIGSPYGWTIISLEENEYLIVHVSTANEFPKNIMHNENKEFYINGHLYNITKNIYGEWDINSVEYDEEYFPGSSSSGSTDEINYNNNNNNYQNNNSYTNQTPRHEQQQPVETQAFSFNNYDNDYINDNFESNSTIQEQQRQIESLQQQIEYEKTQHIDMQNNNNKIRRRNYEIMANEQARQQKEIQLLENELRLQKERTQQIEIENNNRILNNLRSELARTQAINTNLFDQYKNEQNASRTLDLLVSGATQRINTRTSSYSSYSNSNTQYNNNYNNMNINNRRGATTQFNSPTPQQKNNNNKILNNLTKKLEEQTMQIQTLKANQNNNTIKLNNMQKEKEEIESKTLQPSMEIQKMWQIQFGNNNFATDFAGNVMSKDKFGQDVEGGWNIDYYDPNSIESFIASTKTIKERAGKTSFTLGNFTYNIIKKMGKWEIVKTKKGQNFQYSATNMKNIAAEFKPDEPKDLQGKYETYSSLLINLNHFPLIQLNKFEEYLKQTLSSLPFFKEIFIYSNEKLYRNDQSDISSYARVFFKSQGAKDDIQILLTTLSLKKGMHDFVNNFKGTNVKDAMSFSMVLYNHKKLLKFVHAQSNFELLRSHPVPLKIPRERVILDKEYNAILKFHENDLWKQLKPFALDWHGNTYYVCDIDVDRIDITFDTTTITN